MSASDEPPKRRGRPPKPAAAEPEIIQPTASFGPAVHPMPVAVSINTDALHLSVSNLTALGQLAERSPELAMAIVDSTRASTASDAEKYKTAAKVAGAIAIAIIVCSAAVAIGAGFWPGFAFFLSMVVVLAVVTVIFTGKAQDISWIGGLIRAIASRLPKA